MRNKNFKGAVIFFAALSCCWWGELSASGELLQRDPLPVSRSLGDAAGALPLGSMLGYTNPAQFSLADAMEFGLAYEKSLFDNQYTGFFALRKFGSFPIALGAASLLPQNIDEINNLGQTVSSGSAGQYMASLHGATAVSLGGYHFHIGLGGKVYREQLPGATATTGAGDLGILLPFRLQALKFLPYPDPNNFHLALSGLNLGPPLKFSTTSEQLPMQASASLAWGILQTGVHEIEISGGAKYYIVKDNVTQSVQPGAGIQYSVYRHVFFRGGATTAPQGMVFAAGMGLSYAYSGLYVFQGDYSFQPQGVLGSSHQISLKISSTFQNMKQKVETVQKEEQKVSKDINAELLQALQTAVGEYKLDKGNLPPDLNALLPYMKNHGFSEIPKPVNGELSYYPATGKVSIDQKVSAEEFKDVIELNDGSVIPCNILKKSGKSLEIEHKYGKMTVDRGNIRYISSKALNDLDSQMLRTLQNYINDYHSQKNRYPADMVELREFLRSYQVERIPNPTSGTFEYEGESGILRIKKINAKGMLNEEVTGETRSTTETPENKENKDNKENNGNKDPQNGRDGKDKKDEKEKDIFEFDRR